MAAVAAEPGAAVPTTTRSEILPEPGPYSPAHHEIPAEPSDGPESSPGGNPDNGESRESRHVGPEQNPGAGPVLPATDRTIEGQLDRSGTTEDVLNRSGVHPEQTATTGLSNLPVDCSGSERVFPGLPNSGSTSTYQTIPLDPQPPAVFLHSVPDPAPVSEAGLSLAEPAEPTETTELDRCYTILEQEELVPGPTEDSVLDENSESANGFCKSSARPKLEDSSGSEPSSVLDLSPGAEVRVSLEHVIDDALVVSFRLGEQVFSGVLMDVSKRFGPFGIPVTVFPRRDDRCRPAASLQMAAASDRPRTELDEAAAPQPCGPKPPPLFQEGAPYPPPLFIRDTYHQALPQPPPRKIKRPKRRYRSEEPTSIMNAIKLRPRQVLCDKCKGVVASGGHREARRGEEATRRRRPADAPMSSELKRLKMDDKSGRSTDKRSSGLQGPQSSRRVLRGVVSSSSSTAASGRMRLQLNSKKGLTPAADRPDARKVLQKLAPHRRPKDQNQDRGKAVTRAATLQNHGQKVHFTRRLQNPGGATVPGPLPPRMRLKPQRYRTDDPAPSSASEASPRTATSPTPSPPAPPTPPPAAVAIETSDGEAQEGAGWQEAEPPLPSSCSLDSSHSECSSTETFDLPPPGNPPSSSSAPPLPPPSSFVPLCTPLAGEDEEDGDPKRRRKSSTSSSSSSSSSSSVFSKSVSKCLLPDGRTVCVGDIVWAKIYGFPWWPARVLGITVARRGDTGLAVRQEARVSWFGSPTTSFLPLAQLSPFLETFQSRFDKKRKGPYRRAIAEAASAAKQLTPERAAEELLTLEAGFTQGRGLNTHGHQ
ncbi:PWWP domain-containing protein 2A [Xiphophorus couchianus]|uniref:PWWP domain-containing protein 2A n=1 Tax=Xiphophorus couchianus TaxID=32473 RepID=UPI001016776D|nr:PWWP domain-containing protein 2A [Xiphophorus couchianus]